MGALSKEKKGRAAPTHKEAELGGTSDSTGRRLNQAKKEGNLFPLARKKGRSR